MQRCCHDHPRPVRGVIRIARLPLLALCLLTGLAACSPAAERALVRVDGSSTFNPLFEAIAEDLMRERGPRLAVAVGVSGTGGGIKKFCRGAIDIALASRGMFDAEREACRRAGIEVLELAFAVDEVAVVVPAANRWLPALTPEQLRTLWAPDSEGVLVSWRQLDPAFPDLPVRLYGPGTDSGTFDFFTRALSGRAGASRADFTASEDDNLIVRGVAGEVGALGFVGQAWYLAHADRLRRVPVVQAPGEPALLARELRVYVDPTVLRARPAVAEVLAFALDQVDVLSAGLGLQPLPDGGLDASRARLSEALR